MEEINIMFIDSYLDFYGRICVRVPIYVQLINGKNVSLYKHRQQEKKTERECVSANVYSYVYLIQVLLI